VITDDHQGKYSRLMLCELYLNINGMLSLSQDGEYKLIRNALVKIFSFFFIRRACTGFSTVL